MKEQQFSYHTGDDTKVEMIIREPDMRINHMVLAPGGRIDQHMTTSTAWILVTDGVLDLDLDDQEPHRYATGDIVVVPGNTMLGLANTGAAPMRLFVIKREAC